MKTACIALAIAALAACAYFFQQHTPVLIDIVIGKINGLGMLAPILFLLLYFVGTLLLLPTMVFTLAGGALFGPFLGSTLNLLGATAGAACAFCISRYLVFDWLIAKENPRINKLITGVEDRGWQFVALLRLIPIVPFSVVNYGLGLTHIKFNHYVIATAVFLAPAEIIYTYCGYAGMDLLAHPSQRYKSSSLIFLIGLTLLFIAIKLLKRYKRKRQLLNEEKSLERVIK